jgi:rhodanese-related sulfurtransferase
MKMKTILTIFVVGVALWFLYSQFSPTDGLKNLGADEFQKEINESKDLLVIDVREVHEYKAGYIPGAINIPLSQLNQRLNEIPKDKDIYLYCQSGNRSKQAANMLLNEGFYGLSHLQGGMMSWNGKVSKVE